MFSWKWENKICSWFSKREESFYKSQFLRSQIHALRFLPGQWDDSREKQISPTPLQNPCRDGKWDYIHPLPLSLSWELGICCKKCNLSPKYHQSLTFSDIILRKCAQFSIRVTFSRTLYMYIVDFPQLHRTEDLTKGFEISPNLSMSPNFPMSMSPFKLFPNVSIQVSELNPDREFMSVCCITTWNKDLK